MKYSIKYDVIDSASQDFAATAKAFSVYSDRIGNVKSALDVNGELQGFRTGINARAGALQKITDSAKQINRCMNGAKEEYLAGEQKSHGLLSLFLLRIAVAQKSIGSLFHTIADYNSHQSASLGLMANINPQAGAAVVASSGLAAKWLFSDTITYWLKKPYINSPKPSTKEQEKAADLRMKTGTQVLRRAAEDKWRKAKTDKEKMSILNSYLADIQNVMGTSVRPRISYKSFKDPPGIITYGTYDSLFKRITINEAVLNKPESINLLKTVVHEVRHAYQNEAVWGTKHHTVSEETLKQWRRNIFPPWNYKTIEKHGFDAYYNQPVEKDARWFAGI